jgi:threonine dehydrogenase-like Zn-dependent dehydrogenase
MTIVTGLSFLGHKVAELREFEINEPGPTEVRIAIKASGLCGSDLHYYAEDHGLRDGASGALLIAGHEPAGVVEAIGSEVRDFKRGDRVLVFHIMGCGNCYNCRLGHPVVCTSSRRASYGGQRNGAHAPLLLVEERSLIRIPEPLTFVDGAMIACGVGTAYSALLKAELRSGQSLLVTGLGPVGLAVTLLAAEMGLLVVGSDPNRNRVAVAMEHGLSQAVETSDHDEAVTRIRDLTGGRGVDAAIDCSGANSARLLCIHGCGTWGRVILVGVGFEAFTFEPTRDMIAKQLTLRGSWVSSQAEMQQCAELLAHRKLHPEVLVTERLALAEGVEAYQRFAAGESGKMVFTF